mmetsp:Transcript_6798/g.9910  ORF Transcript_6798/g.9910 Transcript_6798/m.9910 type:complete len:356 (+) Transcript_6798:19-1086(+)
MVDNPKKRKRVCAYCQEKPPNLIRPATKEMVCKECFFVAFEREIHETIVKEKIFKRGERVVIAASGGKDSTVLAHTMKLLNDRYDYGLELFLLSIDEGIKGYRDDSLETVKRNKEQYQLPLKILSYKDLYNWTMDQIVAEVGTRSNCSFCGVFRRQALDRGCQMLKVDKMVTGHNADDMAETILMNILRGDIARLQRCVAAVTHNDASSYVPRAKPFKFTYEKEIVLYARYKKLDYFTTECTYATNAYRGYARELIKELERIRPQVIIDVIHGAEQFLYNKFKVTKQVMKYCERCNYISSQRLCRACMLLDGLNAGQAKMSMYSKVLPSSSTTDDSNKKKKRAPLDGVDKSDLDF